LILIALRSGSHKTKPSAVPIQTRESSSEISDRFEFPGRARRNAGTDEMVG
jgi:hypothetical protein